MVSPRWSFPTALGLVLLAGCGERLTEHVSEQGGFRILLPGEPREVLDRDLPKGTQQIELVQRSGTYAVAWQDLPGEARSADERLDRACDGAVERLQGKVRSRTRITLDDHPGRNLMVDWPTGQGVVHSRLYLVGDRLYQINASGPRWWVESATSRKVLDSFRLVDPE